MRPNPQCDDCRGFGGVQPVGAPLGATIDCRCTRSEREALIEVMAAAAYGVDFPHRAGRLTAQIELVRTMYRKRAVASLAAIEVHNGGIVLVPVEPTSEMREAAAHVRHDDYTTSEMVLNEYRAQLAASPYAPESSLQKMQITPGPSSNDEKEGGR